MIPISSSTARDWRHFRNAEANVLYPPRASLAGLSARANAIDPRMCTA